MKKQFADFFIPGIILLLFLCGCQQAGDQPAIEQDQPAGVKAEPPEDKTSSPPPPPEVLDLDRALALMKIHNPFLKAAARRIEIETGNILQASLGPNPALNIREEHIPWDNFGFGELETKVTLSQTFELGGKRAARTGLAESKKRLAVIEYANIHIKIRLEVTFAFNNILYIQENIGLLKAILEATEKLHAVALTKLNNGKISRREFLHFDLALNHARLANRNARAELKPALAILGAAVGFRPEKFAARSCSGDLATALPPEEDAGGFVNIIQTGIPTGNPGILAATAKVDIATQNLAHARTLRIPNATVGIMFAHNEAIDRDFAGFSLDIPIPVRNTNQGGIKAAASELLAAKNNLNDMENKIHAEFQAWKENYLTACANVIFYQTDITPQTQEAYDIAVAAFQGERLSYVETLDPLIALLKARQSQLLWLRQAADAKARLAALGGAR
ncbi:TolC family protein [Planctomycetota bacterium]